MAHLLALAFLWLQAPQPPTELYADVVAQPMAISFTTLTSGSSTSNGASTASISPTANALVILSVAQSVVGGGNTHVNDTLAVSGNGITWTEVSQTIFASRRNIWVFIGTHASPSSGAITLTFTSGAGATFESFKWSVVEAPGIDTTTPIGTAATVSSSGSSATLSGLGTPDAGDAVFAAFALEDNNATTLNSELDTKLHDFGDSTGARHMMTAYDLSPDGTPAPGITFTSTGYGGVGFIVKASSGGGSNVDVATAAGSLTLGGAIPTILNPRAVSVGLGSMVLSGFASQLLSRISTAAGAAVLSGQAPTAVSPYVVPGSVGSLAASGQAPTAVAPYSLTVGVGQLTATGSASSLASTVRISAGSLTLSGQAPAASAPHAIATSAGSLTLGGFSPVLDVSADRTIATGAGSMVVTGQSPPLLMVIPVAAASATLSGHAPASTVSFVIPTAPGGLSLTGISPALLHSIAVGLGQMLLSGQQPFAVNPVTLSVGAGAVTLTASAPTMDISADLSVVVGSASLTLAGVAPSIGAPQVIAILPAAMLLSGQIPGVDLSNILAVVIQMRPADNVTTSARNELQSNLVRMRHNLEVQ